MSQEEFELIMRTIGCVFIGVLPSYLYYLAEISAEDVEKSGSKLVDSYMLKIPRFIARVAPYGAIVGFLAALIEQPSPWLGAGLTTAAVTTFLARRLLEARKRERDLEDGKGLLPARAEASPAVVPIIHEPDVVPEITDQMVEDRLERDAMEAFRTGRPVYSGMQVANSDGEAE